jgi:tubulin-specific chaperone D
VSVRIFEVRHATLNFKQSDTYSSNVEARRNCFRAIPELLCTLRLRLPQGQSTLYSFCDIAQPCVHCSEALDPAVIHQVLQTYIKGLDDYTTDERGDVGSWVRIASIRGLCTIIDLLFDIGPNFKSSRSLGVWLPPSTYHGALGGILKQGVERLDNVRRQAGDSFLKLLRREPPNVQDSGQWKIHGRPLMEQLFLECVYRHATVGVYINVPL